MSFDITYMSDFEQINQWGISSSVNYISSPDGLAAMYVTVNGSSSMYYVNTDHLGSIDLVYKEGDNTAPYAEQSFDAWGRNRNAATWAVYPSTWTGTAVPWLIRDYTGHEQHRSSDASLGLINMNGRMYDPVLGRMLSPDNYVQSAGNTQNFNRYSYCLNNPLKFTDPSGDFVHIIIGAVIGGVINVALHADQINSWTDFGVAFGIGAVAGAVGVATGGAAFLAAGGAAGGIGGFIAGFAGGAIGAATSSPIQNIGNHLYFGDQLMSAKQYALGVLGGGVLGGSINGLTALANGGSFWNGVRPGASTVSVPTGLNKAIDGKAQEPKLLIEKMKPTALPDQQMPNTIPNNLNRELPASTPVGTRANYMNTIGNNKAAVINGREFSGHALDQMQGRGMLSPSVVEDAIRYPTQVIQGNTPNTAVFIKDNLRVIINSSGKVITVY